MTHIPGPIRKTVVLTAVVWLLACPGLGSFGQQRKSSAEGVPYLKLSKPRRVLAEPQRWEGDQFPHTLSVLELNRGRFRYWGWYGLNEGRGIGLAWSNDLVSWTKYTQNPLLLNARWPTVIPHTQEHGLLYLAFTRDYDTAASYIVLGKSSDGIHINQVKTLVQPVHGQRNQNPNLFYDPLSARFYLTWYRGNDQDDFEIVSRNSASIEDLDKAPEKVLIRSHETIAAPTLLRVAGDGRSENGTYYLATEICPARSRRGAECEWQVKVFAADAPDGNFQPVLGNPVLRNQYACLFQHIFEGRFYGFVCHMHARERWTLEEVEASLQPNDSQSKSNRRKQ